MSLLSVGKSSETSACVHDVRGYYVCVPIEGANECMCLVLSRKLVNHFYCRSRNAVERLRLEDLVDDQGVCNWLQQDTYKYF